MSRIILILVLSHCGVVLIAQNVSFSYHESDSTQLLEPVWNYDTAILSGHIEGYDDSMGTTGSVQIMDVLLHQPRSYLVKINSNGDFYSEIPLLTSQEIALWLANNFHLILLAPGEHTIYNFKAIANQKIAIRDKKFGGFNAQLNIDLRMLDHISHFNYRVAIEKVLEMDIYGYKDYCLKLMNMELDSLNRFREVTSLSDLAYSIKKLGIKLDYYEEIFFYHSRKHGALRRNGNEHLFKYEDVEPEFYDFLDPVVLNDRNVLLTGQKLNGFINKARYANHETKVDLLLPYKAILNTVENQEPQISKKRLELIKALADCENLKEIDSIKLLYSNEWETLEKDYFQSFKEQNTILQWKNQDEKFTEYLGLENGLIDDIINARRFSTAHFIDGYQISKKEISERIKDPFIIQYLYQNLDVEEETVSIEGKIVSGENQKIISPYDQSEIVFYLGNELNQFEGKILYIDFWATWCGPCLEGIRQIRPLKEELRNEPIEFIYITNNTSREELYFKMIKSIEGTHYKIDEDNWNLLSSRFNLGAIPHYMVVDKNGEIIHENFIPKSVSHIKKTLISLLD